MAVLGMTYTRKLEGKWCRKVSSGRQTKVIAQKRIKQGLLQLCRHRNRVSKPRDTLKRRTRVAELR